MEKRLLVVLFPSEGVGSNLAGPTIICFFVIWVFRGILCALLCFWVLFGAVWCFWLLVFCLQARGAYVFLLCFLWLTAKPAVAAIVMTAVVASIIGRLAVKLSGVGVGLGEGVGSNDSS